MTRFSRWLLLGCLAATALGIFMFFWPVQTLRSRALVVGCLAVAAVGWPIVAWKRVWVRNTLLAFELLILAGLLGLPDRSFGHVEALQQSYVSELLHYKDLPYIWGGETEFGVDCSGLVRRAMIRACWSEGLRRLDGGLLRNAIDLWLHDCSAEALRDGYRGTTRRVMQEPNLNGIHDAKLLPGDLAVVANGLHIMVYLGEQRWIEADPEVMKVIEEKTPSDKMWFHMEVKVVRWSVLEDFISGC